MLEHSTQPLRLESLAANAAPELGISGTDDRPWPPKPLEPTSTPAAAGGLPSAPDAQTGLSLPTTAPSEVGQTLDPVVDTTAGATLPEDYAGGDPLTNPRNLALDNADVQEPTKEVMGSPVATPSESAIDPLAGGEIAVMTGTAMPEAKSPQASSASGDDPLLDSPVTHPEPSAKPVSGDSSESLEQPAVDQSFASLPNSARELGDGDLGELPAIEPTSLDTLDPGMFLVDPNGNGQVTVRYVFDGGQLTSQVALVSWSGMDRFKTLQDIMQEALRRATTNSELGFLAIDDRTEGAILRDAELEGADFNQGAVAVTPKTMQMRPGDRLVALAVNHGTIADLLASGADLTGANRPIFSLSSLNPQGRSSRDADYFVDVTGRGQTFGLEDLRMDRGRSDRDLNDIVFAIEGATGKAPLLSEVVNPSRNWLDTDLGRAIVELDQQLFESVAVGNGPLDLTTQLPGDRLPPAEATRPTVVYLATNELGTGETIPDRAERIERTLNTISPNSPAVITDFEVGAAVAGSPTLVDTLKANSRDGLPPVVVLDLDTLAGQTNRIQETLELLLARQVTVVIPAGDGGRDGLPDGLPAELPAGVIVVGAVQPAADGAIKRSPNSNYGPGLTLMADGRAPNADGSLSDRTSTLIAAGRVAGAIAELKAANPDLSPRQISTILQQTARDLYGAGPDLDSGSGLLNFPAALSLAERTLGDAVDGSQNLPPAPPRFDVHGFYNAGDPIQFQGLARDFDGVADLDRVEFVLVNQVTGDRQLIGTAEQFRPTGETGTTGRFRMDIEELPPGRYELEGRTVDAMGLSSVLLSEAFTVLSRSATTAPLPSSVLRAIETAAQLDRYDRADLEATRNWIAGLQPGASPAAVAARLGADLVESGLIPGSYVFRFADDLTPEAIQARLQADPDVQFAYPLVPIGVELFGREHLELTKTLEVWGSNGAASPSLGDLARASTGYTGDGSVVAIVDDGLQLDHPNFLDPSGQNRDRSDLDWDYAANDDDPSPRDQGVTIASATPSNGKTINGSTAFAIPTLVPWTGIINGGSIAVDADFEQLTNLGLRLNLYVPPAGSFLDPSNWWGRRGGIYSSWSPGWGGGSSPKVEAINSPNQDLDKALGEVAGGFWELRLQADRQRNYTAAQLRDFATRFIRGYQLTLDLESTHGTSVAGVAVASPDPEDPSERAVGAAPDADLVGVRLTANAQSYINPLTVAKALGHRADLVDVFNNSWGTEEFASSPELLWSLSNSTQAGAASQVMAAGNEGDRSGTPGNVNARLLTSNREAIVVGAIDLNGAIESYSTPGANITLVAPIPNQTTDNDDPNLGLLGSNPSDLVTSFGVFDGTSAAAPLVSGVVALMQEAYGATSGGKELSARDVKHILIATANPTVTADYANDPNWSGDASSPLRHHPQYGFGVVDAAAAVTMAEQWGALGWTLGNFATTPTATTGVVTEDQPIPKNKNAWLEIPIDLDSRKTGAIEDLELTLTIQNPSADLKVELVAPDGTVSAMGNFVHARDSEGQPIAKTSLGAIEWTFGSVRHWGSELSTNSTWTLRVQDPDDSRSAQQPASKLLSYEFNVYTNQPTIKIDEVIEIPKNSWFSRIGSESARVIGVAVDQQGNVWATGAVIKPLTSEVSGNTDPFLVQYDPAGNIQRAYQYSSSFGTDYFTDVQLDSQERLVTVGYNDGSGARNGQATLSLINRDGRMAWQTVIDDLDQNYASSLIVGSNDQIYVAGLDALVPGSIGKGGFLAAYSIGGELLWQKKIDLPGSAEYARSMAVDSQGNAYVVGTTQGNLNGQTNNGASDIFVTKYSESGDLLWTKLMGSNQSESWVPNQDAVFKRNVVITIDESDRIYVAGTTQGILDGQNQAGGTDGFLASFDTNGTQQWVRQFGGTAQDEVSGVAVDNSGTIYVTGHTPSPFETTSPSQGGLDSYLLTYSPSGDLEESIVFGSTGNDVARDLYVDSSGNIYLVGETSNPNFTGSFDGWIAKNPQANDEIPIRVVNPNHWNARYINGITGAANVAYDFSNPVARQDLGNQSGNVGDDGLRLSLNMAGSPAPGVAADNFAMQAWTRKTFEAGQLYRINTQSSDSVRFRLYDRQTNEWIGDNLAYQGDNAHWRNDGASTTSPERTMFFKVPETGEYDFYVEARDGSGAFDIDIQVSAHQPESVTVDTNREWQSVVYWWDRRTNEPGLGNTDLIPATDFFQWSEVSTNIVETFSAGSNRQPNGQPGLRLNWEDRAINNDWSLPDNNFAILNNTKATLESGVFYQASVRADDGFQIWMNNPNLPADDPDRTVYVTPEDTWQYAYQAAPETFYFTVPETAEYEVFAGFYEVWGNARLELDWQPVTVTGQVIATIGANIRSGPSRSFGSVGLLDYGDDVTFDQWVTGEFVAYPELRTATDRWYRIAGTNNWVSGSVLSGLP